MSRKLFENLKLLILSSPELEDEALMEVEQLLKENKAQYDVKSIHDVIKEDAFVDGEYTHIISNTIYFKLYNFSQENLIPVVTSEFVFKTIEKGSQPGIRPFSPDPRNVLKKVHICVGGLPDADKEVIHGGVRALGGSYSETLNKFVTHLISMDPDEDCCIAVNSIQDFDIKIVLPYWIDDCIKTRRKLDEAPYLLKSDVSTEEQIEKIEQLDVFEKDYNKATTQKDFLKDKSFYIGKDLEFTERYRELIKTLIRSSGGYISKDLNEASYYIGKYRDGDEYLTASRKDKYVGNINWIFWMVEYQKWISPCVKLLHYPYVRNGLPEMKDLVISSTNYSGDARYYIMKLVAALGAKFTPSLTQQNTHLIAATSKGKKYSYSLRWNLKVVNHLWLEETYQKWRLQPFNHPRYSHYPRSIKIEDIIGETPLDPEVLKSFYETDYVDAANTSVIEDSEGEDILPTQEEEFESRQPTQFPTQTETLEPLISNQQELILPDEPEELEVKEESVLVKPVKVKKIEKDSETPSKPLNNTTNTLRPSSGRKAKDKAAAKLHENMEELNYFQKQHKSKDIPLLPDEIKENKKRRESEKIGKEAKKVRAVEEDAIGEPTVKKTKKSKPYHINAIATGWEVEFSKNELTLLSNLGINIFSEFKNNVNTIISPKLMRTEKFLVGLSYRLEYIISPIFLKYAIEAFKLHPDDLSILPDVNDYSIEKMNKSSVKELTDVPLATLLRRCQERIESKKKLFKSLTFNITSKVPGGIPTITKILNAHGAESINVLKSLKDLKNINLLKKSKDKSIIFLGSEKGFIEKVKELFKESGDKGKIIEWDWVVQSIFHMELEHGKNIVYQQ